jgi:hypothetical protein
MRSGSFNSSEGGWRVYSPVNDAGLYVLVLHVLGFDSR